ncbi:hypothetical protein ACP6PM_32300 [Dapis sp. BLCC M229]
MWVTIHYHQIETVRLVDELSLKLLLTFNLMMAAIFKITFDF